jgi:predicted dinucleotide-binding enzyme
MRIGILSSGLMGGKLGTIFARAGHDVVFSYSRSQKKLERLARDAGGNARAGTPREAAQDADVLLLAVHWSRVDDVLRQAADLSGKVIVSCSLPMNEDDSDLVIAHTSSGAEELAKKTPGSAVDAGPLQAARYIEPFTLLVGQLAYEGDDGPELAYRFEHFGKKARR